MKTALIVALLANLIWGLSPVYYFFLGALSPGFLLSAQVILTFMSLSLIPNTSGALNFRNNAIKFVPTAALVGLNWLAYLVAVLAGRTLEASYGYLIAPILTVVIGQAYFKETIQARQALGLIVCILAVTFDIVISKTIPYFGFLIALPFALYVLAHKRMEIHDPVASLRIETGILLPFALLGLSLIRGDQVITTLETRTMVLLPLLGLVTALPLVLFVRASVRLTPAQLGACQFIAPVASALVAVLLAEVEFSMQKIITFSGLAIGMGLTIFAKTNAVSKEDRLSCQGTSDER